MSFLISKYSKCHLDHSFWKIPPGCARFWKRNFEWDKHVWSQMRHFFWFLSYFMCFFLSWSLTFLSIFLSSSLPCFLSIFHSFFLSLFLYLILFFFLSLFLHLFLSSSLSVILFFSLSLSLCLFLFSAVFVVGENGKLNFHSEWSKWTHVEGGQSTWMQQ